METQKYVPLKKRSKKEQRRHYETQRNGWNGVVPVTRVIPDKKKRALQRGRALQAERGEY